MRLQVRPLLDRMKRIFTRENTWALILCLVVLLLAIITVDSAPLWIYQGF